LIRFDRAAISNLLLCGLVTLVLISIWYVPHFSDVREIFQVNQQGAIQEGEPAALSLPSFTAYAFILAREQIQLSLTIPFILGLIYSLIYKRSNSAILFVWVAGGFLICTLLANKDPRYTVGYLPAIAIFSASLIEAGSSTWRRIFAALIVAVSLFSFFN